MADREFRAELVRVVDGDTVDLRVDTGFYSTHTVRFRLAGIDAPERNADARGALIELLAHYTGNWFPIIVSKTDKYGRWLVTIPLYTEAAPGATVNQRMIDSGHAKPYDGGKKS